MIHAALSTCTQLKTLSLHPPHDFDRERSVWSLLFAIRSRYLAEINILVGHIRDLMKLPNKSVWSDIDEELCRLSEQSTGAVHPLRVSIHLIHSDHDEQILRDHLEEAWPLFCKKGELVFTQWVPVILSPRGCYLLGERLAGGGRRPMEVGIPAGMSRVKPLREVCRSQSYLHAISLSDLQSRWAGPTLETRRGEATGERRGYRYRFPKGLVRYD